MLEQSVFLYRTDVSLCLETAVTNCMEEKFIFLKSHLPESL